MARRIDPDVHLGYRKGKRGGVWLVRWRNGSGYRQAPVGTADDSIREGTLDFDTATKAARAIVEQARVDAAAAAAGPILTVRSAVETYIAARDARESRRAGRAKRSDAAQRLGRYVTGQQKRGRDGAVLPAQIGEIALHALKEGDILNWRNALPATMKASTHLRLVNDFKAALNAAYTANRGRLAPTLPAIVKHGLRSFLAEDEAASAARDNQILSDAHIKRLIATAREVDTELGWAGDLYRMVLVLAATGARFSQIARLRVAECQIAAGRLIVPVSRKGRGGKSGSLTIPIGRDILDGLSQAVDGRPGDAFLLERWRSVKVKGSFSWERGARGPWQSAAELVRPWHAIRERACMPEVVPYALRHSSIVRAIRANLPIRLVATLHDTSTAMIERHYSKWITSGLEDLVRAAIVPLVAADDDTAKANVEGRPPPKGGSGR